MKFIIEHLSKNFEKKEVLRDIDSVSYTHLRAHET